MLTNPPYATTLKPYGQALVELAHTRKDVICLSGDLSKQCEVDLFQEAFPDRFINVGMAEANMMSMAGALARAGLKPFVHTFGVFATRRPLDQLVNSIAYPNLPVRIVGFMPGISSPGGPSHQAIDDLAYMRAVPNMTVLDLADTSEIQQAVSAVVDIDGPVYLRLKRGEIPLVFDESHTFSLSTLRPLVTGRDVVIIASGMMLATALAAAAELHDAGLEVGVAHSPVIKPLDVAGVLDAVNSSDAVVTAENHSIIGGLGSAVAEVLAEHGVGKRLHRLGIRDTFAEGSASAPYLFDKYGLSTQALIDACWAVSNRPGQAPRAPKAQVAKGEYSPV